MRITTPEKYRDAERRCWWLEELLLDIMDCDTRKDIVYFLEASRDLLGADMREADEARKGEHWEAKLNARRDGE